jgi:hypothetical protein
MNFIFNFWDNLFAIIGIIVSTFVAVYLYSLSKRATAKDKFDHELKITNEIRKIKLYSGVILSDVKKYHPLRIDHANKTYIKQGGELYTIIPEYGVQVILMPSDENIPVGLIPFEWIEYVRNHDSEDNKPVIVCKFKGVKWYSNFKSPFKEINYIYSNPGYKEDQDPDFLKFTTIKPKK